MRSNGALLQVAYCQTGDQGWIVKNGRRNGQPKKLSDGIRGCQIVAGEEPLHNLWGLMGGGEGGSVSGVLIGGLRIGDDRVIGERGRSRSCGARGEGVRRVEKREVEAGAFTTPPTVEGLQGNKSHQDNGRSLGGGVTRG